MKIFEDSILFYRANLLALGISAVIFVWASTVFLAHFFNTGESTSEWLVMGIVCAVVLGFSSFFASRHWVVERPMIRKFRFQVEEDGSLIRTPDE